LPVNNPNCSTMPNPELSIVIVNSDGTEHTLACLDSIFLHPPSMDFEVILVDNCSVNSCLPLVTKAYPEVRAFSAPQRQGFARNYNLGIRQARGEYILILNNDTRVYPGSISNLVEAMQSQPQYGLVGPQLRSHKWQIQSVCARGLPTLKNYIAWQFFLDTGIPTGKLLDLYLQWRISKRQSGPVPCISGACMLTSRRIIEEIGLLDEEYEFYYEDIEWCHRAQIHEYEVAYIAEAKLTHLGDQSLSKVKEQAKRSEYLSAVRYFRQYHQLTNIKMWLLWTATLLGYGLRFIVYQALEKISGKGSYGVVYKKLTRWVWTQPPPYGGSRGIEATETY
jgi:GT2 family glycosyltransferase